jgi:hypothetical protein
MRKLRVSWWGWRSWWILRRVDNTESDEPLMVAYQVARDRGLIGDFTFHQFAHSARPSWRDRRLDARITKLGL